MMLMKRSMIATIAVSVLSVGSGPRASMSAQVRRTLQPDDIFELKTVGDPRVSPDAQWIAYTVSWLDRKEDAADTNIYMVPAGGGFPVQLTNSKKPDTSPRWSPDGRYLAFLSRRDGRRTQVYLLDRRGGDAQVITDYKADVSSVAWSPDSSKLAVVVADPDSSDPNLDKEPKDKKPRPQVITRLQFMRDGEGYLNEFRRHIHLVDIATHGDHQLTSGPNDDAAPAWSPDGRWIAFSSNRTQNPDANDNSDIFLIEAKPGAAPRALTSSPGSDTSPAFSPDGTWIAYLAGGNPKDIWYATNNLAVVPVTGAPPRILTSGLDRNVRSPQFTPDGTAVMFLIEEAGNSHLARVPLAGGAPTRALDGEHDITAYDVAKTGDVALLDSHPQQPSEVFLLQARSAGRSQPVRLTHVNDRFLGNIALATVERYTAKSADGTMIDAYLCRPTAIEATSLSGRRSPGTPETPSSPPAAAAEGRKLPTILRIHGGPVSQYSTGFNLEWQMLAAAGFAVVAANPRGSSGYGREFSRAIFADWGNKDYEDIIGAVDAAIQMGVADPERLGVGGWSYGGILTDHVISKTTRFKAAISGASEFNYLANYGTDHYQRQWEAELGLPWHNTELWIKLSPFYRLDKIVTPTLVMGGDSDMNVPILGGEQLYQGLKRLGRETELVIYPGESHTIRRPSFQKDRFERYIAWYSKYLKPNRSTSTPLP